MKKCTYCSKEFIAERKRYTFCSSICYKKHAIAEGMPRIKTNVYLTGVENPNWRNGVAQRTKMRKEFAKTIRKEVLKRDNYTCQICGQYSGNLHVDHIEKWSDNEALRFSLDNCRTVCVPCHYYLTFKRTMPTNSRWGLKRFRET